MALTEVTSQVFLHNLAFTVLYYKKYKRQHGLCQQLHNGYQSSMAKGDITESQELLSLGSELEPPPSLLPEPLLLYSWLPQWLHHNDSNLFEYHDINHTEFIRLDTLITSL